MIGHVIILKRDSNGVYPNKEKWVIFDTWGDQDEYYCITDFETQTINELISKNDPNIVSIEDLKVEWMFLARREKNLKDLREYLK